MNSIPRVWAVEDDPDDQYILRDALLSYDNRIDVEFFIDADSLIKRLTSSEREWPDLIMVEAELPRMDGFELIARLRQMEGVDKASLIMLTGWNRPDTVQRAMSAGANCVLHKPISVSRLEELLSLSIQVLRTERSPETFLFLPS